MIRDEISRKSVPDAVWLKPGIAYMNIEQFNETTSPELEENLKRLGENNIKGLVLDLRENPGGLLNEGVAVADRFLRKGQAIVSHRGRASQEKTYVARHGNGGHDYPIVVLVNRYSASAAEIVTGALQDHDRAWVLGENTFGKGLVQTVYPLQENTGLALTTAKYYTPSGRLIQRDYAHQSFFDYYNHKDLDSKNMQDVKMTDGGRTVYGGGGISPDEKYVTPKFNPFQVQLLSKFAFFNFSKHYFGAHDTKLPHELGARPEHPDRVPRLPAEGGFRVHRSRVRREQRLDEALSAEGNVHHRVRRRRSAPRRRRDRSDGGEGHRLDAQGQGAARIRPARHRTAS